jgi:hypothetical protein
MYREISRSEYAADWKVYRTRWILAWLSLLASFGLIIFFATHVPNLPKALAVILGVVPYVVFYLYFLRWRCPRSGNRFTTPDAHALKRSKKCSHCGLLKNYLPEDNNYPVS